MIRKVSINLISISLVSINLAIAIFYGFMRERWLPRSAWVKDCFGYGWLGMGATAVPLLAEGFVGNHDERWTVITWVARRICCASSLGRPYDWLQTRWQSGR